MNRIETMRAAAEDSSHWWWKIGTAPVDLRDLLAVADAAREVGPPECEDCYEDSCTDNGLYCPCDERCHNEQTSARMALRNALVRLDAS